MIRLLKSKLEDTSQIREKPILSELTFLLKLNVTYLEKLKMHKTLSGYLSLPMSSKAEFKYLHFSWNYMLDRSAKFYCRNLFESSFCFILFQFVWISSKMIVNIALCHCVLLIQVWFDFKFDIFKVKCKKTKTVIGSWLNCKWKVLELS